MIVYIPLAVGQTVPAAVRRSIETQTEPCTIIEVYRPGVVDSHGMNSLEKRTAESATRNEITRFALSLPGRHEYICVNDSDVAHLYRANVALMLDYMVANPECGAVSLADCYIPSHELGAGHIRQTCVMIRRSALPYLHYDAAPVCTCLCLTGTLRAAGFTVEYLDCLARVRDVERKNTIGGTMMPGTTQSPKQAPVFDGAVDLDARVRIDVEGVAAEVQTVRLNTINVTTGGMYVDVAPSGARNLLDRNGGAVVQVADLTDAGKSALATIVAEVKAVIQSRFLGAK